MAWTDETESYLAALESPLCEVNVSQAAYEAKLETLSITFWNEWISTAEGTQRERAVRAAIRRTLTSQQARVIRSRYYDGLSIRDAGEELGVDPKQIRVQEANSLNKIKRFLKSDNPIPQIGEGQSANSRAAECYPQMSPDIAEVYLEEIENFSRSI